MTIAPDQFKKMAVAAARCADAKKAEDILLMDLRKFSSAPADFMLILGGNSNVHIRALEDAIEEALDQVGLVPVHREGYKSGQWCVIDYGGLLVHIFQSDVRRFYSMERLWENPKFVEWRTPGMIAEEKAHQAPKVKVSPRKKAAVKKRPAKKSRSKRAAPKLKKKKR